MLLGVGINDRSGLSCCCGWCRRGASEIGRRDATADAGASRTDCEVAADSAGGELAFVDQLEDVTLDDAAFRAGRLDLAQVDRVLLGRGLGARGDAGDRGGDSGGGGRRGSGSSHRSRGSRRSCNWRGFCRSGRRSRPTARIKRAEILALLADDADVHQARDVIVLFKENGEYLAIHFCRFVKRSLVRFVCKKIFANRDLVANLLVPLADDAAFHRLPLPRHDYGRCHPILS